MRDPYDVLGVQRSAKPAAVKSAYRRLAKKLHPDANPSDPKAAGKFAELNTAYEILGDEAKRRAFDAGEIDSEGKPVAPAFEGFGARPGGGDSRFETFTWGPGGFQRGGDDGEPEIGGVVPHIAERVRTCFRASSSRSAVNAEMANSRSSRLWAAETCTLIRALPWGTTGYEKPMA